MSDAGSPGGRTILVITYAFPPSAYVGVHRTLKYCRYLSRHRWLPVVLTSRPASGSFTDEKLCQQIPAEVEVHRTADFDPVRILEWQSRLRRRPAPPGKSGAPSEAPRAGRHDAAESAGESRTTFKRFVLRLLTESPDSHVFWLLFALPRGLWILLTRKVDLIYSTSPPHSSHIATYLLAKLSRKPYVLDFRDPWRTGDPATLQSRVKRAVVRGASRVICVSQGERDELRAEFPDLPDERFTHITNGYDPTDVLPDPATPERSAQLTLIHAGTIYPGIATEFFDALRTLLAQDPRAAQSLRVQLVGEIASEYTAPVAALEAAGVAKAHGLLAHGTTLRMVGASEVLVILLGGTTFRPSHIPAKVFEYLHARKPILAIAPEGELTRIVRESGLGIVVPPNSVDSVVDALRHLLAEHSAGGLVKVPNQPFIRSFERPALAAKLAGVLDGVLQSGFARR